MSVPAACPCQRCLFERAVWQWLLPSVEKPLGPEELLTSRFWGCKRAEKVCLGRQPDKIKMKGHSLGTLAAPVSTGLPEQVLL